MLGPRAVQKPPMGPAAKEIIGQIGKKIGDTTGESRSLSFSRQRISIEIQRGDAVSVYGTSG